MFRIVVRDLVMREGEVFVRVTVVFIRLVFVEKNIVINVLYQIIIFFARAWCCIFLLDEK
jgi:hypothetical protein